MKGITKGEPKTIKQLRQDTRALSMEHQGQICATEDTKAVTNVANLLFRTFNIAEKGHAMAG